ncbi:MAG: hypothetical protein ACQESK_02260 [Bacteroidota bacterium]
MDKKSDLKRFDSILIASSVRLGIVFVFAAIGWVIVSSFTEEIKTLETVIIAFGALFLSPRIRIKQDGSQKYYELKWWGFRFF